MTSRGRSPVRDTSLHTLGLCDVCALLDFPKYFRSAVDSRVDNSGFVGAAANACRLGFFKDIYRKSAWCSFCDIVTYAICTKTIHLETIPEAISRQDESRNKPMECWIYSYRFASNNGSLNGNAENTYRIGISSRTRQLGNLRPEDHLGDIQLSANDAQRLFSSGLFYGRILNPGRIAPGLPKIWLSICEHEHGLRCELPAGPTTQRPTELLAIDIHRQCICRLPEGSRYIALSYCWPIQNTFTLTKGNMNELFQSSILQEKTQKLPQIIQDTIRFAYELGESYLWVDALCIIQDDDTHTNLLSFVRWIRCTVAQS